MPTCCPTSAAASGGSATADETFRGRDGNLPITDLDWRDPICEAFIEGAVQMGIPRNRDYNGADAGGRQLRAAHHPERPAQERRARLPASGDEAREPHGPHQRPRHRDRARGQARGRRALPQGWPQRRAGRGAGAPRGDPERRHGELAAAPAGLGHRPGAAAEVARHRGEARPARRRREPARPLRAALRRARQERRDHQREVARAEAGGRGAEICLRPQGHPRAQSDADLRVLEVRRAGRQLRPAAHLHAGLATRRACSRPSTTSRA